MNEKRARRESRQHAKRTGHRVEVLVPLANDSSMWACSECDDGASVEKSEEV